MSPIDDRLRARDCVIVHTDHAGFDYDRIIEHAWPVFDPRSAAGDVWRRREKGYRR